MIYHTGSSKMLYVIRICIISTTRERMQIPENRWLWSTGISTLDEIHESSSGIPRMINWVCEKSLICAFKQGKRLIDEHILYYELSFFIKLTAALIMVISEMGNVHTFARSHSRSVGNKLLPKYFTSLALPVNVKQFFT